MTRTLSRRLSLFIGLLVTLQSLVLRAAEGEEQVGLALLESYQQGGDSDGLTQALHWLQGNSDSSKRITDLLEELGHSSFKNREKATHKLAGLGYLPGKLLEEAKLSNNPEIAARAKRVATLREPLERDRPRLFKAAFDRIASGDATVPFKLLLDSPAHLETVTLRDAWVEAIASCATKIETPWLLEALTGKNPLHLQAALRGLPRANPEMAIKMLSPLVEHTDLTLAFPATHGLLELGENHHLKTVLQWTASKEEQRRIRAVQLLRGASGQNFGLDAYAAPKTQKQARGAWTQWLAEHGNLHQRRQPLKHRPLGLDNLMEDLQRGLLAHYQLNELADERLVDLSGHKRHGTLRGNHELVDGMDEKAIRFEGQGISGIRGGHAELPYLNFNELEQFSLALWVKQEALTWEHGEAFICYGFDQGATFNGSLCIGSFFDQIHFRVGSGKVMIPQPEGDLKRWMHYAMTYRDGELRVFRNGTLVAKKELAVDVKGNQAALGRHWWSNGFQTSTRFVGALDEIRIYDRALTDAQVSRLFDHQAKP